MQKLAHVDQPAWTWRLVPALLLSTAAFALFVAREPSLGYPLICAAIALAFWLQGRDFAACPHVPNLTNDKHHNHRGHIGSGFAVDLSLIASGLLALSLTSVAAKLGWWDLFRIGGVLATAVAVPFIADRWLLKRQIIRFPWRGGLPWGRYHAAYLVAVLLAGYLVLPWYFISTNTYLNWPVVDEPSLLARLFIGVNAVGVWDELFFICAVFVLLRRHFPAWIANLLQASMFVPFLWELGYQSWGPLLTIPFALIQGLIFNRTRSLPYVITVHLLFDAFVFLVIARAHNPSWPQIFLLVG